MEGGGRERAERESGGAGLLSRACALVHMWPCVSARACARERPERARMCLCPFRARARRAAANANERQMIETRIPRRAGPGRRGRQARAVFSRAAANATVEEFIRRKVSKRY